MLDVIYVRNILIFFILIFEMRNGRRPSFFLYKNKNKQKMNENEFDVIIIGTSYTESILSSLVVFLNAI